jgi:hypothetical protein
VCSPMPFTNFPMRKGCGLMCQILGVCHSELNGEHLGDFNFLWMGEQMTKQAQQFDCSNDKISSASKHKKKPDLQANGDKWTLTSA